MEQIRPALKDYDSSNGSHDLLGDVLMMMKTSLVVAHCNVFSESGGSGNHSYHV